MNIEHAGKWEYVALCRDMERQGEEFIYPGGFKSWYKEVFLIDEAWKEIRDHSTK